MPLTRLSWHPVTVAAGLVGTAGAAAVAGLPPALWLTMGAAAGFATSGST
ncbi:MAG TPA: hypothetical protein VGX25_25755 [Actinophytocola sp.]|nr:hypothetical protein [Actinophytocola sp.]HEV2782811.1 hypothetical protein [Actinophytocola sp.]